MTIQADDRSAFLGGITTAMQKPARAGTLTRITVILQSGERRHLATIADLFDFWHIATPQDLLKHLDSIALLFIFHGTDGPHIGFAARTRDLDRARADILLWERSLVSDLAPLFFQHEIILPEPPLFQDRTTLNIDWRFIPLSTREDIGIGSLVFQPKGIAVFTTSKDAINHIINTLYDAR